MFFRVLSCKGHGCIKTADNLYIYLFIHLQMYTDADLELCQNVVTAVR